jgi:membrane-associated HD superfamily phosphohydrolase
LANQHHLRRSLRAIIAQHHGTSLIGSFYQKACKQAKADGLPAPEESLFRYQYQLPRQKEIVIVSLADACEAAVKSLAGRRPDYQSLLRKAVSTVTPAIRQGNTNQQELLAACVSAVKDEATPALHPEAIMRKIAEIIDGKWLDRQFVEADISTAELEELKRSIQKTILEIHHFRPEYPDTDARRAAK